MSHEAGNLSNPSNRTMVSNSRDVMFTNSMTDSLAMHRPQQQQQNHSTIGDANLINVDDDSDRESDKNCPIYQQPEEFNSDRDYNPVTFRNGGIGPMDVDSIPIQKDGMAVCEKCGAIGVKHAFYSKSKRFCSLPCSRSYALLEREGKPIPKPRPMFKVTDGMVPTMASTPMPTHKSSPKPTLAGRDLTNSYNWKPHLKLENFVAVPVSSFKHAPLFECWDHIMVGMKVEVENTDYGDLKDQFPNSYWVASVIKVSGYKALLRFEGFGQDASQDFWLNLCKEDVQPVGWCASQLKPLIPPKLIQNKCSDWKSYLVKRLTGARTLPADFHDRVAESLASRFRTGMQLEVVDKNRICSTRVAIIDQVLGGRLHVHYAEADTTDEGFWCHERSPLIHPMSWSQRMGHEIVVSNDFLKHQQMLRGNRPPDSEADWDFFPPLKSLANPNLKFKEGMKLEAIDPLNLGAICVATITKVLKQNYMMVGIDGYNTDTGSESFCHHLSSTSIFPAGFSALNGIELTPPTGFRGEFKWAEYLRATKSRAAPVGLFNRELQQHGFKVGMKLEAVDLMEPRLICVATVAKVVGRLLCIHFDGWDSAYDQWCDCESPDLYPVGWCEVVGYPLEAPRIDEALEKKRKANKKNKSKKKKRSRGTGGSNANLKTKNQSHRWEWQSDDDKSVSSENVHGGDRSSSSLFDHSTSYHEENHSDNENIDIEGVLVEDDPMDGVGNKQQSSTTASTVANSNKVREDAIFQEYEPRFTIPRLVDGHGVGGSSVAVGVNPSTPHQCVITPELWSMMDVSHFLRINECGTYADSFMKKKVDGRKLLTLSKEQIVNLTGMKVGPSLKIHDLIQQLKAKVLHT